MTNYVLFLSSLFLGWMHMIGMVFSSTPTLFKLTVVTGVFASIWNHGTTTDIAKWLDRLLMIMGAIIDTIYANTIVELRDQRFVLNMLLVFAIGGYLLAKKFIKGAHLFAHVMLSIFHFIVMFKLKKSALL